MAIFTTKHYVTIAEHLLSRRWQYENDRLYWVEIQAYADMFITDNPQFKRQKFYKACGVEELNL